MKKGLFISVLLCANLLAAQKLVKKSYIDATTSSIQIETNNCFEVDLRTSLSDQMVVEATIDGEYKKDLLLNIRKAGTTVFVSTGFQPNFVNPNDKLSAHKVISIALTVMVPRHKSVKIYGTSSNITVTGSYEELDVVLEDGRCTLNNTGQTVAVTTQSGDIYVSQGAAEIKASSKYGKIFEETIPEGDNRFTLRTTTGNIHLKKTK
ncbi:DUF4097 family beta strand repeat-containing protein [Spongiimicrobium sp. 2-473A-2-J]|uniref:DUF4097 family beta strand repeat-containing protein n=1 Tax=Eudoraea algarum TaxID=3417568 RepID=UPI003D36D836